MKKGIKLFILVVVFSQFTYMIYGQQADLPHDHKWGIKIGLTQIRYDTKNEPLTSGRGLGCSIFNNIDDNIYSYGGKLGIFYQLSFSTKSSMIIGPEILFNKTERGYTTGLSCANKLVSDSKGILKFQNFTFFLPLIFRQETSFFDMFLEIGGYHDLTLGNTTKHVYTTSTYLNYMYQTLPEPKVTDGTESLSGSNYGLIFGLGNGELLKVHNLELRAQYYLSLSKTLPLGEYRYVSQSGLDISLNYRF